MASFVELEAFIQHGKRCDMWRVDVVGLPPRTCTCGLSELLRQLDEMMGKKKTGGKRGY